MATASIVILCTRSSADKTRRDHITKEGNEYLRWMLIEAALHASCFDAKLQGSYQRVAARRGRQRAIVGVARELLVCIYHVLSRSETLYATKLRGACGLLYVTAVIRFQRADLSR